MRSLWTRRRSEVVVHDPPADPHPLWMLTVGLLYLFRTAPGLKAMQNLEQVVRHYAANPQELWRLLRSRAYHEAWSHAPSSSSLPGQPPPALNTPG